MCKDRICACMVLYPPFPLVVYATLTLTYLYSEFEFRAHFQCVVHTYGLKCVENANQLVSTQGHEYSYEMVRVSALTNQIAYFEKSILKCVDSVICKFNLNFEICYTILRKTILFLTLMLYFALKSV